MKNGIIVSEVDLIFKECSIRNGFTLAEVLITLGIIGIVASMTLPSLVAKHRKKVLHTQFLKAYSDIQNAAKRFETDNGITIYEYSFNEKSPTKTLKTLMSSFIGTKYGSKVSTDYDEEIEGSLSFEKAIGYTPKNLAGKKQKVHPCDQSIITEEVGGRIFSMDDAVSIYDKPQPYGPKICIDINGRKGPNIYGYDWFVFIFTKEGSVKPYIGSSLENISTEMGNPEKACDYKFNQATYTCAYFALTDTSPENPKEKYWTDFLK